jgi:hypothetical protein
MYGPTLITIGNISIKEAPQGPEWVWLEDETSGCEVRRETLGAALQDFFDKHM